MILHISRAVFKRYLGINYDIKYVSFEEYLTNYMGGLGLSALRLPSRGKVGSKAVALRHVPFEHPQRALTMTSDSISPGTTSAIAIPAIDAKDSTINIAGGDQTFVTNIYNVDPNCDRGIWTNQPAAQTHHLFRQNLPVVVRCHHICELSWSSQGSPGRHLFVVHRRCAFRTMEGNGRRFCLDLRHTYVFSSSANHHRF
jgi:hypothetical protein